MSNESENIIIRVTPPDGVDFIVIHEDGTPDALTTFGPGEHELWEFGIVETDDFQAKLRERQIEVVHDPRPGT